MTDSVKTLDKKKGNCAEDIIQRHYENEGCDVEKYPNPYSSGGSLFDFLVTFSDGIKFYVEAKAQIAFLYSPEKIPCYCFPKKRIDTYVTTAAEEGISAKLEVADPEIGWCVGGLLDSLLRERKIEGRTFPAVSFNNGLGALCYYFPRCHFDFHYVIPRNDLIDFRKLYRLEDKPLPVYDGKPPEELPLESAKQIPETTVPQPAETTETPANEPEPQLADEKQLPDITLSDCLERIATATKVDAKYIRELILDFRKNVFEHEQNELRLALLGKKKITPANADGKITTTTIA